MNLPMVVVSWLDSAVNADTWEPSEIVNMEPFLMRSVGFLVAETDSSVVLASDAYPDGRWRRLIAIPKVAITDKVNP